MTQGAATVENCTMSGNGVLDLALTTASSFLCRHCTISDPTDSDSEIRVSDSIVQFANSIVAGNCAYIGTGAIDSLGGNIESAGNTCSFDLGTDAPNIIAIALDLADLADNGGPTLSHLPGVDGAADGGADDALCLATDQRGLVRETNCESGAVEIGANPPTPIFLDGFLQGHPGAWSATVGYVP